MKHIKLFEQFISEATHMNRDEFIKYLKNNYNIEFVKPSEEFSKDEEFNGGLWIAADNEETLNGNPIFSYNSKTSAYKNGVLNKLFNDISKKGWSLKWRDGSTLFIWPTDVNESNELNEEITRKQSAIDFVEKQGSATWKEIHSFLMKQKGYSDDTSNRGNMSSYFSGGSTYRSTRPESNTKHGRSQAKYGLLMIPTKKDPRYLEKGEDGKYTVKVWDKVSKLD